MWRRVASSERKSPKAPTWAISSTASVSSETAMPPTQCLIMRANSLSMTNCPQSKVTPDSIIPEP